uniref:Uncharacterized protein n=1 Tax=Chromera velia CCMP2878 TaxID=1169474 RepID=A0A0G4IFB8_9ALVE|eukprot:Cvel_13866.t1-p1 / transcript=Cvel_13866.t1 / gene=Cvel_13866 / organism=Chromera_velia_CCMP2878 / gene_product=hypothetical protein / transcript_product=hypothetical protein / location=Cvel_scaffold964:38999-43018(+) / protein_length=131 / sequence_SO=supercontig / SO=protein_coding / is_pseudo=false
MLVAKGEEGMKKAIEERDKLQQALDTESCGFFPADAKQLLDNSVLSDTAAEVTMEEETEANMIYCEYIYRTKKLRLYWLTPGKPEDEDNTHEIDSATLPQDMPKSLEVLAKACELESDVQRLHQQHEAFSL